MKTLELNQMELVEGGEFTLCDAAVPLGAVSAYSGIFFAAGPVGWLLAGVSLASFVITAYECDPRNK